MIHGKGAGTAGGANGREKLRGTSPWVVRNPCAFLSPQWIAEVSTKTITSGDNICVVLEDKTSGAVFAECPVDNDKPLDASVEPVLDSSRYFVLRVVDPASGRHAFLGLGFREREHAISFRAALDDHRRARGTGGTRWGERGSRTTIAEIRARTAGSTCGA